jgi:hypothetical protein
MHTNKHELLFEGGGMNLFVKIRVYSWLKILVGLLQRIPSPFKPKVLKVS